MKLKCSSTNENLLHSGFLTSVNRQLTAILSNTKPKSHIINTVFPSLIQSVQSHLPVTASRWFCTIAALQASSCVIVWQAQYGCTSVWVGLVCSMAIGNTVIDNGYIIDSTLLLIHFQSQCTNLTVCGDYCSPVCSGYCHWHTGISDGPNSAQRGVAAGVLVCVCAGGSGCRQPQLRDKHLAPLSAAQDRSEGVKIDLIGWCLVWIS